jgi:hypothetical protein
MRFSLRHAALLPFAALVLTAAVASMAGYLLNGQSGAADEPAADADARQYVRGIVERIDNSELTITVGTQRRVFRLNSSVKVDVLRPADLAALHTGDWLNVGAVPHDQTLFAITGLVIIPANHLEAP